MIPIPDWTLRAACREADPRDFFPSDTGRAASITERVAKMVCADCPVATRCLLWQMEYEGGASEHSRFGIYGGLNGRERAELARGRAVAS